MLQKGNRFLAAAVSSFVSSARNTMQLQDVSVFSYDHMILEWISSFANQLWLSDQTSVLYYVV